MIPCAEVIVIDLDRSRTIYRGIWDPLYLDPQELYTLIKLARALKNAQRCPCCRRILTELGYTVEKAREEVRKLLRRANRGEYLVIDPLRAQGIHALFDLYGAVTSVEWFCDFGARGKYFTGDLAKRPFLARHNRLALMLNPWSLDTPSDADTIIDSNGYHKAGSIGKSPFSIKREHDVDWYEVDVTFYGASDTTIQSIWLALASYYEPNYSTSPSAEYPAPPETCDPTRYASIYSPTYALDCNIPISTDTPYGLTVKVYLP